MSRSDLCLVIICVLLASQSESARILGVFPIPSISHQIVFRALTTELANRGHELVILTPDPAYAKGNNHPNITEIDVHDISYNIWRKEIVTNIAGNTNEAFKMFEMFMGKIVEIFEAQMNTEQMQALIHSKQKFDLLLIEACVETTLILSHLFKAPVIQVSSLGPYMSNFETIGAPMHFVLYPALMREKIHNLTIWEKIGAVYHDIGMKEMKRQLRNEEEKMIQRNFGSDVPSLNELSNNIDMLFLNVNPVWENNRPVPPGVIFMGGLHQKPEKKLPEDLKSFLDSSKNGVIYMSFGTNVDPSLLPAERIAIFCKVFAQLPYDIIWKWSKDEIPGKPENVKIFKWLPQADLLRHPKIKLFITQAGLQSTDEAITAGVPLLAFPMLGDQWYNAEKYEYFQIGLNGDIKTITEQSLKESIKALIEEPSYRSNIVSLRTKMSDQPQSPMERAVWWAEYVIRHKGAKFLRSPAANMSLAEYYMLDVLAVILSIGAIVIGLVWVVVRFSYVSVIGLVLRRNKLKGL